MDSRVKLQDALITALDHLPTAAGGASIILATAGPPPTITPLSTGDVAVDGDKIRLAIFAGNSAVEHLGGSCTLLVPTHQGPLRVALQPAVAREAGPLAVIEGDVVSMRPSHEPPWSLRLDFLPAGEEGREAFVEYWRRVRSWLEQGAPGEGPQPPDVR
ncbi:MAG: hypothetical protein LC751_11895 [Actinobacteria bacterium]|nr:hypothetical protein [Actinomycetota bacterium]MCA1738986.1 hypothetical protein [Actinomycetota bacterium]